MRIIILGAGQVGSSLAENLVLEENNDITVVDVNSILLRKLEERLDIRVLKGQASLPRTLSEAGAMDAELLIAVTNNDEVNMIACQIAHTLYKIPTKIARIRQTDYFIPNELFRDSAIPIDVFIIPEKLITLYIKRIIDYPGAIQVLDFAGGKVRLVAVRAYYGGPIVGKEIQSINRHDPTIDIRIAAIFRKEAPIPINAHTTIEVGDEIFFIADIRHIKSAMKELRRAELPCKSIIIAGGGNIGFSLAEALENNYNVKIIEQNLSRCNFLSKHLERTIVLNGSASDKDLLLSESIGSTNIYIALTNDDEANIMSSLLAKKLGVKKVISLINNTAYIDLVQNLDIDITFSPQLITTSHVLKHMRHGDVVSAYSLRRGSAEAIEVIVRGDENSSKVVGKKISQLNLPNGASVGSVVRQDNVFIANKDIKIEKGDHVILFIENKKKIKEIEKLFEVHFNFF